MADDQTVCSSCTQKKADSESIASKCLSVLVLFFVFFTLAIMQGCCISGLVLKDFSYSSKEVFLQALAFFLVIS